MGGRAFHHILSANAFPRLPSPIYHKLKAHLLPKLENIYEHVTVPAEAPEKVDYGDLDFVVASPRLGAAQETVRDAIGASHMDPFDVTSHFAVPLTSDIWPGQVDKFFQVDVHVCPDVEDFNRVVFFHGYGDIGMILGSLGRSLGLSLGTKGLKLTGMPYLLPPFHLTSSVLEIVEFMGLSMTRWMSGILTQQDAFNWVATSPFFDPGLFERPATERDPSNSKQRQRGGRPMYQSFLTWAQERPRPQIRPTTESVTQAALIHFGKKQEYDALILKQSKLARAKQLWSGSKVREWLELDQGQWKAVKQTMTQVREEVGGEEGIGALEEEQIKQLVKSHYEVLVHEMSMK